MAELLGGAAALHVTMAGTTVVASTGAIVIVGGFLVAVLLIDRLLPAPPSRPAPMPENVHSSETASLPPSFSGSYNLPASSNQQKQHRDPDDYLLPEELRQSAQKRMDMDTEKSYNFAVVGGAGAGKSSLVNGLCGRKDSDKGAAEIGVTETTDKPEKYVHPKHSHIVCWDMPGSGTPRHPANTYFMDLALYAFDFLIIVSKDRFREPDLKTALSAEKYKIPFAFVRTNSDADLNNLKMQYERSTSEMKFNYASTVRNNLRDQLPPDMKGSKIFVVSKWALQGALKMDDYGIDEQEFLEYVCNTARERRM